jgi:hypothetical protein
VTEIPVRRGNELAFACQELLREMLQDDGLSVVARADYRYVVWAGLCQMPQKVIKQPLPPQHRWNRGSQHLVWIVVHLIFSWPSLIAF